MKKLGILLALTLLASAPAMAQSTSPFFRMTNGSVGGDGGTVTPPPGDTNDNGGNTGDTDEYGNLIITYADVAGVYGSDYQSVPVIPPGYAPHDFSFNWPSPDPSDAEIDPNTGVITWHANFKGTVTASVGATVSDDQGAIGSAKISVPTDYSIVTSPASYTQQYGSVGLTQSFVATTVPAQSSSGEVWSAQYVGNELPQAGNVITFSSNDNMVNGYVIPESSPEKLRFVRTDSNGVKTYGDWVDINVTPWPNFSYPASSTADYKIEDNNYMQMKLGATVDIPASKLFGAAHLASESNIPWASPDVYPDLVLPPGLTMDTDGRIHGTVGGSSHAKYDIGKIVANGDDSVYGYVQGAIFVVDTIQSDIWHTCYTDVSFPQWSQTSQMTDCHDDDEDPPSGDDGSGGGDTGYLVGYLHGGVIENERYRVTGTSFIDFLSVPWDQYQLSVPTIVIDGQSFQIDEIGTLLDKDHPERGKTLEVDFSTMGDPDKLNGHTLTIGPYTFVLGSGLNQMSPGFPTFHGSLDDDLIGDFAVTFE